jgi:hypothetical protein
MRTTRAVVNEPRKRIVEVTMKGQSMISKLLTLAAILAFCAPLTFADSPGRHPGYLHALTDLRTAQYLLRMDFDDNYPALRQVNMAINVTRNAAIDDRKPLDDHPRLDSLNRGGRLQRALEALNAAERDITQEEDNPYAVGWRNQAIRHIDAARRLVNQEMRY